MHKFISGLSIPFHWSICLFLCQYHTVLITVALYHCLKSRRVRPPALLFFLRIALVVLGLLWFHINFCIILFVLTLYAIILKSISQLRDIWNVSRLWWLHINCYKHSHTDFCVNTAFNFTFINLGVRLLSYMLGVCLTLWKSTSFPVLHHLTFPPTVYESSNSSTSLSTLSMIMFFCCCCCFC